MRKRALFQPCRSYRKGVLSVLVGFIFTTFAVLHFVILPRASGAYNKPCYLSAEQLEDLRYMVRNIITIYEDMNVTYWLDFGTLLGAVRTGDILRHDGDADISRISPEGRSYNLGKFRKRLKDKGIESNSVIAWYRNLTVDLQRWQEYDGEYDGKPQKMLRKNPSKRILSEQTIVERTYDETVKVPRSWVIPAKTIDFIGMKAKIPRSYEDVLKNRYPLTYHQSFSMSVPYKWKCWVPFLS